jgi:DNA-binding MarR family transcriptional regulator
MAETRWLDREDQRTWRTFMLATRLLFEQFDRELQRGASMPTAHYEVLVRLSEAPQRRLRMSDLADRSQSSRSRLSHAIARLEEAGWVAREACPSDRRGAFAVLTDAGFAALEAAAPVHVESVRAHLFDQLDPRQLHELRTICERILQHLVAIKGTSPDELGLLGDLGDCGLGGDGHITGPVGVTPPSDGPEPPEHQDA